mgnify:CR=1 FL=1
MTGSGAESSASYVALEVTNLHHRYGERESLRGVSFSVAKGDLFALLGPNGGGKTTLFRLIAGEIAAETGNIALPARTRLGRVEQEAPGAPGTTSGG